MSDMIVNCRRANIAELTRMARHKEIKKLSLFGARDSRLKTSRLNAGHSLQKHNKSRNDAVHVSRLRNELGAVQTRTW